MSSAFDSAVVDTAMIEDPRLLVLPRGVRLVHLEALVWSKLHRTDGFIPTAALRRLTDEVDGERAAELLVHSTRWEVTEGGWQIVGFTGSQMSAERVERKVQLARAARDRYENRHPDRPRRGTADGTDTSRDRSSETSADAAASLPASQPARARQVGGRSEAGGEALAGTPPPLKAECFECGSLLDDDHGYGSPSKPACFEHYARPPKVNRCEECGFFFREEDGHECGSEVVEGRYLRAIGQDDAA